MLVVPIYRGIDWRHPPLITIALVLVNCFVFFFIQGNENKHYVDAASFYFESRIDGVEFPAYIKHLKSERKTDKAYAFETLIGKPKHAKFRLLMAIQRDSLFQKKIESDQILTKDDEQYRQWRQNRDQFNKKFDLIITESYGFKPADIKISSVFAHMFMHGGIGHLLSNMIFLLIIGFAVEAVLGKKLYLAAYIATGLCAVGLFGATYNDSLTPLVGASGAIAGLMGLYTVLFGFRRIRFFYFVVFYFGFIKAPAIIVLPFWVLKEFYQLTYGGVSNVAYMAHIGGLLGGATVGFLLNRFYPNLDTEYMDKAANDEQAIKEYEEGMKALTELNLDKARAIFTNLGEKNPHDKRILQQLYNIEKYRPDSDLYHRAAHRILNLQGADAEGMKMIHTTFYDYIKTAKPGVKMGTEQYMRLADKFLKGDYLEDVEKIIGFLLKANKPVTGLSSTILALANAFNKEKRSDKAKSLIEVIIHRFPQSTEAHHAQQMLKLLGS